MINVENRVLTNVKTYISDVCQTVQNDSAKALLHSRQSAWIRLTTRTRRLIWRMLKMRWSP